MEKDTGHSAASGLARYLWSVRQSYPGGLPPHTGDSQSRVASGLAAEPAVNPRTRLVVVRNRTVAESEESALLEAALAKGMKIDPSEVRQIFLYGDCPPAELSELAFDCALLLGTEVAARVLGGSPARGLEAQVSGKRHFVTHSLGDVLSSPAFKKEFWVDLQKVMQCLAR